MLGMQFSRLVVVGELPMRGQMRMLQCRCACGNNRKVSASNLRSGHTKSCGCFRREDSTARATIHGKTGTGAFRSWIAIRQRCVNPNTKAFKYYGARGITVCERWRSFANFLEDMGERPESFSLDRIDNDKGYEPGNCRWASTTTQTRNRPTFNVMINVDGKDRCLAEVAEDCGLKYRTLHARIFDLGWDVKRAITTPIRRYL